MAEIGAMGELGGKMKLLLILPHLFQLVHQPRESAQSFQVAAPLIGHPDEPVKGVVHAVVEFRGRGQSRPEGTRKVVGFGFCYRDKTSRRCPKKKSPILAGRSDVITENFALQTNWQLATKKKRKESAYACIWPHFCTD